MNNNKDNNYSTLTHVSTPFHLGKGWGWGPLVLCLLLSSCSLYKKYESTASVPENLYNTVHVDDKASIAQYGWRQVFTDAYLQTLIETALKNNSDVKVAALNIEKADIAYKTSKLAYLPTFTFNPTGSGSKNVNILGNTWSYNIGISASWQLDIFGAGITNAKRGAKAQKAYAEDYKQAVECQLISSVAQLYYKLLGTEKQLEIQKQTLAIYESTYESVQTLFETGYYKSPAVHQTKAQLDAVRVAVLELEDAVVDLQRDICVLLNEPSHVFEHGKIDDIKFPESVGIGVPADILKYRPDVRAAERQMEIAYYNKLQKQGNLYPNITITANGGWMHPETWFVQGIGSLVQPIFQGGKLRADLKCAKIDQQIALEQFRKTVINAGYEVENALHYADLCKDKAPLLAEEVTSLREAVIATQELMNNGTSTYIEVLSALENLLNAQNTMVQNQYLGAQALVQLYAALGGGKE